MNTVVSELRFDYTRVIQNDVLKQGSEKPLHSLFFAPGDDVYGFLGKYLIAQETFT